MSFRWTYAQPVSGEAVSVLQNQLGVSETIARLLVIRGVDSFEKAKCFFRPKTDLLHDPYLMKDMDRGAARLARAIRDQEKVLVYGDYDVDGTSATAIVFTFLKQFGVDVSYFIPHRFKDGYGISIDGIKKAMELDATVVVSVDCGITAIDEAKFAKEQNIDLIICDHHTAGDETPDAYAVLNPKQPDCNYPFDGLSGAGVAFKLVQAVITELGLPASTSDVYLDLVALSIASDIVPIVDENRVLMRLGLRQLNESPRVGLKSLMELIKLNIGSVSTTQIVFSIGPRINAAGRMGDAGIAVELMTSEDYETAAKYARELEAINVRRRNTDSLTMERALGIIESDLKMEETPAVILHDPDWHLGVIGIVASRIVDLYCRPTIMLSSVDGMLKGSARSIKGFNIYDALKKCEDHLVQFGGHEFAAGLTLTEDQLKPFIKRFKEIADCDLCEEDFKPELMIDADLDLEFIDVKFWKLLSQFEPFGPDNMRPVFVSKNLKVVGTPTIVGNGHLKMRVAQNGSGMFEAIGFNMHEYLPKVRACANGGLDMAYVLEENTWNNKTTLQMRIKDISV